ncbi:MAG: DNA polymerase I [Phycisphaeraceae bacterium]|nr:DNA polymerase I [Phycisphaeraceae bacterium]
MAKTLQTDKEAVAATTPLAEVSAPAATDVPTLYLIDGYAQFFRAYHAIRTPMTSPVTKEPTNMTFGFLGMLLKLLRLCRTSGRAYVAVCLDVSGDRGTFRSELYAPYKATRPPPPEDLEPQVERCLATLRRLEVPIVGSEGFEADDCIATLVTRLAESSPDVRVRIISKDKDLKQVLRSGENGGSVELFDIHTDELTTEERLREEFGLSPAQVIDMLALMGDNVDNVPGVAGVGPKTAAKLVSEHGTLDGVLDAAAAGKIKGKMGEKLAAAAADREALHLSRRLVTLRHDVPLKFELESARSERVRLEELIPILKELGFNRYQDETRALLGADAPAGEIASTAGAAGRDEKSNATASGAAKRATGPAGTDKPTGFATLFDSSSAASGGSGAGGTAPSADALRAIAASDGEYRCLRTPEELRAFVREAVDVIRKDDGLALSIDTETTGLSPMTCQLCGVCLSYKPGTGVYVPARSPEAGAHMDEATVLEILRPVLEDASVRTCGHNLKYDLIVLRNAGVRLAGFVPGEGDESATPPFDSMVASYLIDATRSSHSLDALAMALLNRTNISIKDLLGPSTGSGSGRTSARTFESVPLEAATQYAAEDADVTLRLRGVMLPQLRELGLTGLFERLEMPLVEVLAELEFNGVRVDRAELDRQRARLQSRIDELKKEIDRDAMESIGRTFNPDSPKQLAAALFNKPDAAPGSGVSDGPGLGLRPVKRTKTGYSTDAEVLEQLAQDATITTRIPGLIVEHRELTKLVSTYLVALAEAINPRTGRVHSSFNQTVAVTGRLASSDPNLQNIPIRTDVGREIRRAFVAEAGQALISADYSQIELRLLAHLSRDPALIEAFHQGEDIHTTVAAQIAGVSPGEVTKSQRSAAKMVNFGIVYGITPFGLARRLGVSNTEASTIIDGYKKRFAGITTFLQECVDQAQRHGFVQTMLGRRRAIPDIESSNPSRRALADRTAINTVVQGSAADLIKLAMVDIHRELERVRGGEGGEDGALSGLRMLLQIHDELVFECPAARAEGARAFVVERMERAASAWRTPDGERLTLSVPIRVDASISENWFDGK